ncbi:MAG: XTP/dITP diphosphohydrolase [Bacillota bacterium]|jgi:XTP/dITP diphosphohydrolase|nr:XTP/dITP diphosphohydrolase [Bacillota bacterium]MDK2960707.1 XTP/dITP diphosphohydrolase [Bacillota bacterium]
MAVPTLVLATRNEGKVAEFKAGLAGLGITILSLSDFPTCPEIEEDGETFSANALKKARAVFAYTGLASLADDSGLEVDALGGAPGVLSHRFAGPEEDDAANNAKLLALLSGQPAEARTARFRAVLALVWGAGKETLVEGTCEGRILEKPRGEGGFGYDPLFYVPGLGRTLAELSVGEKNSISHRGTAIKNLRPVLAELIEKGELTAHAHRGGK